MGGWMALLPLLRQENWTAPRTVNYLQLGLGFLVVEQAFELYLNARQRKYLRKDALPVELTQQVAAIDEGPAKENATAPQVQSMDRAEQDAKEEKTLLGQLKQRFARSQAYNLDKNSFSFASITFSALTNAAILMTGFNVWVWGQSQSVAESMFGLDASNEIAIGSLYLVAQSLIGLVINLPLSLYSTFVVEAKHGFNKTTPGLYVSDMVKSFFIENALVVPLMAGIVKLVRWGGEHFWAYVWMLTFGFSILMLTLVPNVIMPMFNKYEPLPEGELKTEIEKLAKSLSFPLTKLYIVDGSKRSSHSNAYLFGFFKDKRIVLYDTLIKNEEEPALACTTQEVVGILAHECGHWVMSHTLKMFILQNGIYLLTFKGFSYFLHDPDMYSSFGFSEHPVIIGFSLFFNILSPLGSIIGLGLNSLTRKFEYEADAFAVNQGKVEDLKSGLTKISISNLSSFDIDPLYHMFHHSHPSLIQRLRRMDLEASVLSKKAN